MIRLHSDYLVFELDSGESVPCSVEAIAFELVEAVSGLTDRNIIENAARAVVHYFREELHKETVSIQEFIESLAFVLKGFGFEVETRNINSLDSPEHLPAFSLCPPTTRSLVDILDKQPNRGGLMELQFFQHLRKTLKEELKDNPQLILFTELRPCVQSFLATSRWTKKCESFSAQIVQFLQECLTSDSNTSNLKMVIR